MAKSIKKNKSWYSYAWVQIVISYLLLSPVGNAIYDHTKNIPVFTFLVTRPLSVVWNWIVIVLTFKISVWIILVSVIAVIAFIYLIIKFLSNDSEVLSKDPDFFEYKKDVLKKWLWEWDYQINGKMYEIIRLRPLCIKDEVPLVGNGRYSGLICPHCETRYGDSIYTSEYSKFEDIDSIKILIEYNIKIRYSNR